MSGFKESAVYMSIAAGRTMAFLKECLGEDAAIVRVMPNTPAAIGRGISGGLASDNVQKDQLDLAARLMQTAGEFHWLKTERQIDAVTAVSGSGPAYVFLLAECLAEAAKSLGLPDDLAERLGRMTVAGSGELLLNPRRQPPSCGKMSPAQAAPQRRPSWFSWRTAGLQAL